MDLIQEAIDLKSKVRDITLHHWLNFEVFSWIWWLEITCIVGLLLLWIVLLDRKRIYPIIIHGFFVNIAATFLDVVGSEYVLWEYTVRLLPQIPLLYPVDFVVLPVINMIIYQYCTTWKKYMLISILTAAILSFLLEPISVHIHQYILISWKYIYSFPIYFIISVYAKLASDWIVKLKKD